MGRPVSRNEEGMTLIEVMIAMAIAFIMFLGLAEGTRLAVMYNVRNALRDEAVGVGEMQISRVREVPYDNLVAMASPMPAPYSGNVTRSFRGMTATFPVTATHNNIGSNMEQVMITVTCNRDSKINHAFTTIVRQ